MPDRDAGLDRGADVVGVHVAVPDAVAADHDDRVAERVPRVAERRDLGIGRVEEVHDLVARAQRIGRHRGPAVRRPRRRPGSRWRRRAARAAAGRRRRTATRRTSSASPRPPASTTPARASTGSSSGVRSTDACASAGDRVEQLDEARPGGARLGRARRRRATTVRIVPSTGCITAATAASADARRPRASSAAPDLVGAAERVGEAAQDLRQDHARVAARAHERAVRDGLAHRHPCSVAVADLGAHRLERERHVGAGVAVGDRVHVEPVQLLLVRAQDVAVLLRRAAPGPRRRPRCARSLRGIVPPLPPRGRSSGDAATLLRSSSGHAARVARTIVPHPVREECSSWHPCARSAASSRASACSSATRTVGRSAGGTRTCRRFAPSSNGSPRRLHVCTSCLKAGKVQKP